ncbi:hypothetical protein [Streptomyces solaniscabiei]|uniref:hypothetical protein n=1 Tax=Streptomyces solaniscabiei TaxID=2683255 RepID=UPI001CE26A74|nr:hypothetical protein [Streptomyces solaniscabiei]
MTLAQRLTAILDSVPVVEWPQDGVCLSDSWWDFDEQPRLPTNQHARYSRLCRSTLEAAVPHPQSPYKVVLYAITTVGDPAPSLAAAEAYAHDCGWCVVDRFVDVTAATQPWARDGWNKVLAKLRGGFAQGVVTDDRSAVSDADEPYEQTLRWLFDHFSFVAHARPRPTAPAVAR